MSARADSPGLGVVELLLFWVLGLLAAASAVIGTVGAVAARVFGGAWPDTGASDLPGVVMRLGDHAGDPALAWPPHDRHLLPGPIGFYSTAIALALLIGAAFALTLRLRTGRAVGSGRGARWATTRDLRLLRVPRATPGRLTLGRAGRSLVAAEPRQSVIVFGPTQTGKTTGLAIPAILEWEGPVVAASVKTDLLRDTLAARAALDGTETWVFDPTCCTGVTTAGWTPLAGCATWAGAQRTASSMNEAAKRTSSGLESHEFWYAAATKLLAPVLHAAAVSDRSMRDVVRWIDTREETDVLAALLDVDAEAAVTSFTASLTRDQRTQSSIATTAETILAAYLDPDVLASAERSDIDPDRLLDGGAHTLYLCAPSHEQRRLQPIFVTLLQEVITTVYRFAAERQEPLDPPLLLVLDECANIAPLRDLATVASTGAGQGIQLVTVFQDLAQVTAVYGRDPAHTIVSNHRAKLILTGTADPNVTDYAGRLLGDEEVSQVSASRGYRGDRSTTESTTYRNLVPADALRQMPPGEGALVYGHLPPARLALRPWFRDRALRRLAERPAGARS
jgi:type IV secretion system protein VirD4